MGATSSTAMIAAPLSTARIVLIMHARGAAWSDDCAGGGRGFVLPKDRGLKLCT